MKVLRQQFANSPTLARVLPFVVFLLLSYVQGQFGEASRYWAYLAKTLVGTWLIWEMRPFVTEMKWAISWEAVAVGLAVFGVWVGLDHDYPKTSELAVKLGLGKARTAAEQNALFWNPNTAFGAGSIGAWLFIGVRTLGSTLVVPPLEEVFFRSFAYRFIAKPNFESLRLGQFLWTPFLLTALLFGFEHEQWLAGILCGLAYQGLVCWKQRLGDAMTAHAITNCLLAVWVVYNGVWGFDNSAWRFW